MFDSGESYSSGYQSFDSIESILKIKNENEMSSKIAANKPRVFQNF